MRRLLRLCSVLYLLGGTTPLCVAGTPANAGDIFNLVPPPLYPPNARRQRVEGTTVCRLTLDAKGAVTGVRILKSSGNKDLDTACTDAFRHWRAKPGWPGRFVTVPVNFSHDSRPRAQVLDSIGLPRP